MGDVEAILLREIREIKKSVNALHAKIDNFEGFFEMGEDDIRKLHEELKAARERGTRLEELD